MKRIVLGTGITLATSAQLLPPSLVGASAGRNLSVSPPSCSKGIRSMYKYTGKYVCCGAACGSCGAASNHACAHGEDGQCCDKTIIRNHRDCSSVEDTGCLLVDENTEESANALPSAGIEMVFPFCAEDTDSVAWIWSAAQEYTRVNAYDKCGKGKFSFDSIPNLSVRNLSNVGSCDHAFLTYIIERYDTLPEEVHFHKAHKNVHGKALHYDHYVRCNNVCGKGMVDRLLKFHLHNYTFSNNPVDDATLKFVPSGRKNMWEWVEKDTPLTPDMYHDSPCNLKARGCNSCTGGWFRASKSQILNTPRSVYENLRDQQKHANEEIDHFIERSWETLLCTRIKPIR